MRLDNPRGFILEWEDSMRPMLAGWQMEPPEADLRCLTLGLLVEERADRIVIADSLNAHQHSAPITIPKRAIKAYVEVNPYELLRLHGQSSVIALPRARRR